MELSVQNDWFYDLPVFMLLGKTLITVFLEYNVWEYFITMFTLRVFHFATIWTNLSGRLSSFRKPKDKKLIFQKNCTQRIDWLIDWLIGIRLMMCWGITQSVDNIAHSFPDRTQAAVDAGKHGQLLSLSGLRDEPSGKGKAGFRCRSSKEKFHFW